MLGSIPIQVNTLCDPLIVVIGLYVLCDHFIYTCKVPCDTGIHIFDKKRILNIGKKYTKKNCICPALHDAV